MTYFAEANPDPSQKVWSKLDANRQQTILDVIQSALQDRDEEGHKFAEYLGALLALNPSLSKEMREQLASSPSEIIKKALHV
jgi:cation transport regulator ChaB